MLNIYLCEDEVSQLNYFKKVISSFIEENQIEAEIVSTQINPLLTLKDIQNNGENPALFFLDVELKGYSMNGFELAKGIMGENLESYIVFLTSQEDLAYQAFEYRIEPLDYIIKRPEYFLSTRISAKIRERMIHIFEKIEFLHEKNLNRISIITGSRIIELNRQDILFIKAIKGSHQIEIYLPYKKLTIRQSLKYMIEMLDESFIQINRLCIVQKQKIKEINKKQKIVYIEGGYELPVSYREMTNLCNLFKSQ